MLDIITTQKIGNSWELLFKMYFFLVVIIGATLSAQVVRPMTQLLRLLKCP